MKVKKFIYYLKYKIIELPTHILHISDYKNIMLIHPFIQINKSILIKRYIRF